MKTSHFIKNLGATAFILALFIISAPAFAAITYAGGNGTSMKDAILIHGAANKDDFNRAAEDWVTKNYHGWLVTNKAVLMGNDDPTHLYRALKIAPADDSDVKVIYFDLMENK